MSNLFEEVLNDPKGVEQRLLGPTYPYYKNIKPPSKIGMNDNGTIPQLSKNVTGLISYVDLLVSGKSKASVTGKPLGNKFFLKTGGKCAAIDSCDNPNDTSSCEKVDRYIYVNNVPDGNIPFISSGLGVNFSDFEGLIPGAMGNLNVLNPYAILRAFTAGSNPKCKNITMQTISNENVRSSESHYVTLDDIKSMDPCMFPKKKNPITREKCSEAFQTNSEPEIILPDDPIAQLYFMSLGVIGLFILYRFMEKTSK